MAAAQQWLAATWDTVLASYAAEVSRASAASRHGGRQQAAGRDREGTL
jgi:hypothetical protein